MVKMQSIHPARASRDTSAFTAAVRDPAGIAPPQPVLIPDVYALQRLPPSVLYAELHDRNAHVKFSRYLASGGWIAEGVAIGTGVEIASNAVVFPRVTLGSSVKIRWRSIIYEGVTISHHAMIGTNVVINKHASIGAHVSVPDGVTIPGNARITPQTVMRDGRGLR